VRARAVGGRGTGVGRRGDFLRRGGKEDFYEERRYLLVWEKGHIELVGYYPESS